MCWSVVQCPIRPLWCRHGPGVMVLKTLSQALSYSCLCLRRPVVCQLLSLLLQAPNCSFERIFVLPLTSISMSKGTGVVTRWAVHAASCFPAADFAAAL